MPSWTKFWIDMRDDKAEKEPGGDNLKMEMQILEPPKKKQ